jgi:hypothetical protein
VYGDYDYHEQNGIPAIHQLATNEFRG